MINFIRDIDTERFVRMKFKVLIISALLSLSLFTCGCGKDAELTKYEEEVSAFIDSVGDIKLQMEEIDINSDSAIVDTLICLDQMQEQFYLLSEMDVPKEFASVESLADEASEYMTEAVAIYHEVFEADEYDAANADVAAQNYDRAMKRLSYISTHLQGELPEDENLIIIEEEVLDFEPVTEE